MKQGVMAALLLLMLSSVAWATVITFDDIITSGGTAQIPTNYDGFTWDSNFSVVDQTYFQNAFGNTYGFPSAPNAAFNAYGVLSVGLAGGNTFDFNGAYFTTWASNNSFASYSSTTITVNGYNGANLIGTVTMNLPSDSFSWLNANMNGIDRLEFQSDDSPRWWLMDNFTYTAIPEPTSLLLLGTGLGALRLAAWRRRK